VIAHGHAKGCPHGLRVRPKMFSGSSGSSSGSYAARRPPPPVREREREWNRAGEGIKWSKRGRPRTGKRPHAARQVLHDDEDHLRRQHRCTAPRPHKEVSYRGGCGLSQRKRSVGAGAADVVGPRSADGERTTLHWAADKRRERVLMQLGADKRREREGCWRSDGVARGGRRGAGA
jgi:hypothetical protein